MTRPRAIGECAGGRALKRAGEGRLLGATRCGLFLSRAWIRLLAWLLLLLLLLLLVVPHA
jgi:hypothetical protein